MTSDYVEYNGLWFDPNTAPAVMRIIAAAWKDRIEYHRSYRLRLFYGDTLTGRDWLEENYTMGYIGRSTGRVKIPLLLHNTRSLGGGSILTDNVLKIMRGRDTLYIHENYKVPNIIIKTCSVPDYTAAAYIDGLPIAYFKYLAAAARYRDYMLGLSMRK